MENAIFVEIEKDAETENLCDLTDASEIAKRLAKI